MVDPRGVVLLACLVAVGLAGCLDDGELIKSYTRPSDASDDADVTFKVPDGGGDYVIVMDLRGDGAGYVQYEVFNLANLGPGAYVDETSVQAGQRNENHLRDLAPGTYLVDLDMEAYRGPLQADVIARSSSSTVTLQDDWLEILGLLITVGGFATGGVLYLRRSHFLKREIHRIDHIYAAMHSDIASCRGQLLQLREELKDRLVRRKINEQQYSILDRRIDHHLGGLPAAPTPPAD